MFFSHALNRTVSHSAYITFLIALAFFGTSTVALSQSASTYKVGDKGPGGGIVFQVNADGSSGLEAAPTDLQNADGPVDLEKPGQPLPLHGWDEAASNVKKYVWPNEQMDGYLPDKDELELLFEQREMIGGFAADTYWSSSKYSDVRSWIKNFDNGITGSSYTAANKLRVRPIRAF